MHDAATIRARAEKDRRALEAAVGHARAHRAGTGDQELVRAFSIVQGMFQHIYELIAELADGQERMRRRLDELERT